MVKRFNLKDLKVIVYKLEPTAPEYAILANQKNK